MLVCVTISSSAGTSLSTKPAADQAAAAEQGAGSKKPATPVTAAEMPSTAVFVKNLEVAPLFLLYLSSLLPLSLPSPSRTVGLMWYAHF